MLHDLRVAFRKLAKSPSFTIISILTLGFVMASQNALLGLVDGILLKPLPFPAPHELVSFMELQYRVRPTARPGQCF